MEPKLQMILADTNVLEKAQAAMAERKALIKPYVDEYATLVLMLETMPAEEETPADE
jgi:hypothetical protein